MARPSMTDAVRSEFKNHGTLTNGDLYQALSETGDYEMSDSQLKHRIRGCLYTLKKEGVIEHTAKAKYRLR